MSGSDLKFVKKNCAVEKTFKKRDMFGKRGLGHIIACPLIVPEEEEEVKRPKQEQKRVKPSPKTLEELDIMLEERLGKNPPKFLFPAIEELKIQFMKFRKIPIAKPETPKAPTKPKTGQSSSAKKVRKEVQEPTPGTSKSFAQIVPQKKNEEQLEKKEALEPTPGTSSSFSQVVPQKKEEKPEKNLAQEPTPGTSRSFSQIVNQKKAEKKEDLPQPQPSSAPKATHPLPESTSREVTKKKEDQQREKNWGLFNHSSLLARDQEESVTIEVVSLLEPEKKEKTVKPAQGNQFDIWAQVLKRTYQQVLDQTPAPQRTVERAVQDLEPPPAPPQARKKAVGRRRLPQAQLTLAEQRRLKIIADWEFAHQQKYPYPY